MLHLFTHAFFKSLLFLCSGSVIHACGTNEMPQMGGLRKKMPDHGADHVGRLPGDRRGGHSDGDRAERLPLERLHHCPGSLVLDGTIRGWADFSSTRRWSGRGMTAFYMFRLWYMTFAGNPRDGDVYHHAHESPSVMIVPLVILAFLAIVVAWNIPVDADRAGAAAAAGRSRPESPRAWPAVCFAAA